MKNLIEYITESKTLHQNVNINEKLIINKNYNYNSLDDIYKFEWTLNSYGLYCRDNDNLAINAFYKYFVNSAKKQISFTQQCRYANNEDYLCASKELSNGSHLMYLFHLNNRRTHDNTKFLYSKFVFIPTYNGMRIEYNDFVAKKEIYSLSTKSAFSTEGSGHEYYLVSKDIWDEIKTLYKNLCKQ